MSDRGVVFDLGYKPHDGPRLGTKGAVRATFKDGVRRVLGIRRKARKKILPWILIVLALLPVVVVIGAAFLLSDFDLGDGGDSPFGGHAEFFGWVGVLVLMFAALAAPQLLIPDRVEGVMAVYSSRPMRARDYVAARAASLTALMGAFLLVPQLIMYLGFAGLDDAGLVTGLVDRADDLWKIFAATAVFVVGYGAPAFLVSTFMKRTGGATAVYMGVMILTPILAALLTETGATGSKYAALTVLSQHPPVVMDWIFDQASIELAPADAGWDPWVSLAVIAAVAVVTGVLAIRKYRSYM
jgi:ABC-2 type transport system permease protein